MKSPRSIAAPLVLFAALSVVWTWPVAARIGTRVAFDPGDPFLNTWILWWNAQAIPFTEAWWNAPIFYPMPGALALSEHLAGIGLFTTPLFGLGASPALAYNVAFLLSFALSGFFTCLLVHRLTGSMAAGFCAGVAFGLAPFRAAQLSHLQVLTAQWLPLQLLALHAYLEHRRRRWLGVFAIAWVLQGLSNGYYLLFAPGRLDLPDVPRAALLELPPDNTDVSVRAMFRSIHHRHPVINGYSGPSRPHYEIFRQSLRRHDSSPIVELARDRPLIIIVAKQHDPSGSFRGLVESLPGMERGAGKTCPIENQQAFAFRHHRAQPPPHGVGTPRRIGDEVLERLGTIPGRSRAPASLPSICARCR